MRYKPAGTRQTRARVMPRAAQDGCRRKALNAASFEESGDAPRFSRVRKCELGLRLGGSHARGSRSALWSGLEHAPIAAHFALASRGLQEVLGRCRFALVEEPDN